MSPSRVIVGIDPGTVIMGFGAVRQEGSSLEYLDMQVLKLSPKASPEAKLQEIFDACCTYIRRFAPEAVAIEAPFFGKNIQSMLKLGRAQGVAMAAAMTCSASITEYAPRKIKMAITGNGNASKEQVAHMVFRILQCPQELPRYADATDALAAAVCHCLQNQLVLANPKPESLKTSSKKQADKQAKPRSSTKAKKQDWAKFIDQNKDRIIRS